LLNVVQTSFGRQDQGALRSAATPEMAGYFREELEANEILGVRNEISDIKLLSGDLSEAWSEASGEYATVAMRFSLIDATFNVASGKLVEGSDTKAQEVTEIWTFTRRHGGNANAWRLSAIQQVS
jgi:predicted lipid-binding transport protein (Tim44 family)